MRSWLLLQLRRLLQPKIYILVFCLLILFSATVVWQWPDNNLHVIACDVGQGDATLITYKFSQLLIDGGPNNKVLDCLSRYLPFWDRDLEMVVLTHPQDDHLAGLIPVINRYRVRYFATGPEGNTTAGYSELVRLLRESSFRYQTTVLNLFAGDQLKIGGISAEVLWPEHDWLVKNLAADPQSRRETFASGAVLGLKATAELNDYSLVIRVNKGNTAILLPGDADSNLDPLLLASNRLSPVTFLKFPHHGSRTGATKEFLETLSPKLALISVGAKNRFGHPAPATLDLLKTLKIQFLRTDLSGDIEIITDGKARQVKTHNIY